jgi:hypothetical protein
MNINFRNAGASVAKKAAALGLSVLLAAPVVGADDFGEQVEPCSKQSNSFRCRKTDRIRPHRRRPLPHGKSTGLGSVLSANGLKVSTSPQCRRPDGHDGLLPRKQSTI